MSKRHALAAAYKTVPTGEWEAKYDVTTDQFALFTNGRKINSDYNIFSFMARVHNLIPDTVAELKLLRRMVSKMSVDTLINDAVCKEYDPNLCTHGDKCVNCPYNSYRLAALHEIKEDF